MDCGTLHPKNTLFFRMEVGTASDEDGNKFILTSCVAKGSPIVTHEGTGQIFTLSWQDIISLAKEKGVHIAGTAKPKKKGDGDAKTKNKNR